ncbi:MAG: beta-ketoacyl-[acyl-carrier-protein] synthase II, partial [Bacteroidales bacterium]|nr:beta-ketoacyl-[acyl-carrier-protein] synthase II [Bacteroidales bacterium]
MRGFDSLGTLTKSEDGLPRPFSKKRSGFLFAEGGGGILILEELESALKRGADIYAEIIDYESCSDAYSLVQIDKSGSQIKSMLSKLIKGRKIDYFNTHGTGTILNDGVEARVIQSLFGEESNQPVINSTKGMLGHSIGASGAIEAIVSALSVKNSTIHANVTEDPIDNLNLPSRNIHKQIHLALSSSYGFGGHNAAILFKKL